MKIIFINLALIFSFLAQAQAYTREAVQDVESEYCRIKESWEMGEVTRLDLYSVQKAIFEMKLLAGLISQATYCQNVPTLQQVILTMVDREALTGSRTTDSVLAARIEYWRLYSFCKLNSHPTMPIDDVPRPQCPARQN